MFEEQQPKSWQIGNFEGADAFGKSFTSREEPHKLKLVWGINLFPNDLNRWKSIEMNQNQSWSINFCQCSLKSMKMIWNELELVYQLNAIKMHEINQTTSMEINDNKLR